MSETNTSLYIPDNIKSGVEFISGVGWKEAIISAIVGAIAVFASIIFNAITSQEHGFLIIAGAAVVSIGVTLLVVRKDDLNQSMLDHGRRFLAFSKEQQKFKYRYYNPFDPDNIK